MGKYYLFEEYDSHKKILVNKDFIMTIGESEEENDKLRILMRGCDDNYIEVKGNFNSVVKNIAEEYRDEVICD